MTAQTLDSIAHQVCRFIIDDLDWDGSSAELLGPDAVRLTEVLDSAALLELASILEDEFDIEIDDSEIVPESFETVTVLAGVIVGKISSHATAAVV